MLQRNDSMPPFLFLKVAQHARIERGLAINDCMRGTIRKLAEWRSALGAWGTRLARDWTARRLLRNAIRELHQLDDRALADIGITRGEIEFAVRHGRPHAAKPVRTATIFGGCTCDGR